MAQLEDVGYRTTYLEVAPGRANVVTRLPGADPSRGALLVAPLKLPPDLDFTALFHGVDERVPTEALEFGTAVLHRFLSDC